MSQPPVADLVVKGGPVFTSDSDRPWATAFAVARGRVVAVGSDDELDPLITGSTEVLDTEGRLVLPGLADGHVHLGLGGRQVAWEIGFDPSDTLDQVLDKVRAGAASLGPDGWVVGGIISGNILYAAAEDPSFLSRLDAAAGHRPVLIRDDSMHNRWVSSRALQEMGVTADTPDPAGGRYVRDRDGQLTGVLFEVTSSLAEAARDRSILDPAEHNKTALSAALRVMNSFGFTAVQDAATMDYSLQALASLDASDAMTAWVVASMPSRPFIEAGLTGPELYELARGLRSTHLRPDFVKVVMDGMAQTHTAAMLHPYLHAHPDEDAFDPYWAKDELVALLDYCDEANLSIKAHATGDRSIRVVLDAVEEYRARQKNSPRVQIAHAKIVDAADLLRFAPLGVSVDAAPYSWVQSRMSDAARLVLGDEVIDGSWPIRSYLDNETLVATGTDWPCIDPLPDPWMGLETMVTRASVDPEHSEPFNPGQSISLAQAVTAFTRNPVVAMGLGDISGSIRPGLSADFIVLDQNIFEIDIAEVHATRTLATYFEGKKVFQS